MLTPCGRFLGKVVMNPGDTFDPTDLLKLRQATEQRFDVGIILQPAYEMSIQMIPIPVAPGKMAMQREVSSGPVGLCFEENAPLYLAATGVMFFEDMSASDRNRYKEMVEKAREICLQARAQAAGITPAKPEV